jgi:hypothetical protein
MKEIYNYDALVVDIELYSILISIITKIAETIHGAEDAV